ncbi:hypothetical protein V6Z12_D04G155100 [Gossypium hirsutum]
MRTNTSNYHGIKPSNRNEQPPSCQTRSVTARSRQQPSH